MYHQIVITKKSRGWECTIGCITACFGEGGGEVDEMISLVSEYIRNPAKTESEFKRTYLADIQEKEEKIQPDGPHVVDSYRLKEKMKRD